MHFLPKFNIFSRNCYCKFIILTWLCISCPNLTFSVEIAIANSLFQLDFAFPAQIYHFPSKLLLQVHYFNLTLHFLPKFIIFSRNCYCKFIILAWLYMSCPILTITVEIAVVSSLFLLDFAFPAQIYHFQSKLLLQVHYFNLTAFPAQIYHFQSKLLLQVHYFNLTLHFQPKFIIFRRNCCCKFVILTRLSISCPNLSFSVEIAIASSLF